MCASYSPPEYFPMSHDYRDMKFTFTLVISLSFGIATAQEVAPRHEIGLTLGGLFGSERNGGCNSPRSSDPESRFKRTMDIAFGATKQRRCTERCTFWRIRFASRSTIQRLTRNDRHTFRDARDSRSSSLPTRRMAPYFAAGGGWAVYEQSTTTLSGQPESSLPNRQSWRIRLRRRRRLQVLAIRWPSG